MSWSRGRDPEAPGKFRFECIDWNGQPFRAQGGFDNHAGADRAAERAERDMTLMMAGENAAAAIDQAHASLSDDEILAELGIEI